jgi:hypothetical protein
MSSSRILAEDCKEVLIKAQQIYNDDRYCYSFGKYAKKKLKSMIGFLSERGFWTQKQIAYIEHLWDGYQMIVDLNTSFEEGFTETASQLLRDTIDLAKSYKKKGYISSVTEKLNEIKRGSYIIDSHFLTGRNLIYELQGERVDVGDLEERTQQILEKVTISYPEWEFFLK